MSHSPLRKEKDCLNCGAIVQGRYCHVCGQANVEPKESFWHMVTHFFNDITHFDGSFFVTLKDLLLKPGFLSREYVKGRRASYLHPVRMYVFTSAIFFLLFFNFFAPKENSLTVNLDEPVTTEKRNEYIKTLEKKLKRDPNNEEIKDDLMVLKDTKKKLSIKEIAKMENKGNIQFSIAESKYKNYKEYDSIQSALPASKRDGWFKKRVIKKTIDINSKFKENPNEAIRKFAESVLHRLPYMLFVSLPLFALILKLVYVRRKQFFYVDHGVFTIHLYIFSFIALTVVFGLNILNSITHWGFISLLIFLIFLVVFFYLYKAMKNFYGQSRWKTALKFIFVSVWSFIMMIVLFALFMFFSAVTL